MGLTLPPEVHRLLKEASDRTLTRTADGIQFRSHIFGSAWDSFVETWAPKIHAFVGHALGPYGTQPLPDILPMEDGMHSAGATASFDPRSGQVHLSPSTEARPGQILEKLTHEFTHGSLSQFPEGDSFYEEGFVDYNTWVLAHAPVWGDHRPAMIEAASFNIKMRRERAMLSSSDWDIKRWAGGLHASLAYGPFITARLRHRKVEGNLTW